MVSTRRRFEIFKRDGFTCQYCGQKPPSTTLECDHIQPSSKGGGDEEENLITSCFECNRGKSDKELDSSIPSRSDAAQRTAEAAKQYRELLKAQAKLDALIDAEVNRVHEAFAIAFDLPQDLANSQVISIRRFVKIGLPSSEIIDAVEVASARLPYFGQGAWKYFCGVCWSKCKELGLRQDAKQ